MNDRPKQRGLGRGLSALMSDVRPDRDEAGDARPRRADARLPVEQIRPNPDQPRRSFDQAALDELANSIREKGVIQPIIVRRDPAAPDQFQIVAGERRWRAAQLAQLHEIPVLVRDYDDTEMLEIAIVENIQRADLNPIDEARGLRQLIERFGHSQEQLAGALGKSRSHIANQMRLLSLPEEVLQYLAEGRLTAGQARPLIGHPDAVALAARIVKQQLSAREAERLARKPGQAERRPSQPAAKDADTRQIEGELGAALGMGVSIDQDPSAEGGRLTIRYRTLAQLDDLLRTLSGG